MFCTNNVFKNTLLTVYKQLFLHKITIYSNFATLTFLKPRNFKMKLFCIDYEILWTMKEVALLSNLSCPLPSSNWLSIRTSLELVDDDVSFLFLFFLEDNYTQNLTTSNEACDNTNGNYAADYSSLQLVKKDHETYRSF